MKKTLLHTSKFTLCVFCLLIIISCKTGTTKDVLPKETNYLEISNKKYKFDNAYLVSYTSVIEYKTSLLKKQMDYEVKLAGTNNQAATNIKNIYQKKIDEWLEKKKKGIGFFLYLFTTNGVNVQLSNNDFLGVSGKGNIITFGLWTDNANTLKDGVYSLSNPQVRFETQMAIPFVSEFAIYLINRDFATDKEDSFGDFENGYVKIQNSQIEIVSTKSNSEKQYFIFNSELKKITDSGYQLY